MQRAKFDSEAIRLHFPTTFQGVFLCVNTSSWALLLRHC